jgi:hypothetical protein
MLRAALRVCELEACEREGRREEARREGSLLRALLELS